MTRLLTRWCPYSLALCIFGVLSLLRVSCGPVPPLDDAEALQNYFEGLVDSPHSNLHQILQDHSPPSPLFDLNDGVDSHQAPSSSPATTLRPVQLAHNGEESGSHPATRPSATFSDSVRASTGLQQGLPADSSTTDFARTSIESEPVQPSARFEGHSMPVLPGSTLHSAPGPLTALMHTFDGAAASHGIQPVEVGASTVFEDFNLQAARLASQESMHPEAHPPFHVSRQHDLDEASGESSKRQKTTVTDPDPLAPLRTFRTLGRDTSLYKVVLTPDPAVDHFLATLRARIHNEGAGIRTAFEEFRPIDFSAVRPSNWDLLAVMTFWHRSSTKELLLYSPDGYRRLFVTFMYKPKILSGFPGQSFLSVWTIAPPQQGAVSSLYLHGLYPFTPEEYRQLTRQPEAGGDFWITVRHGRPNTGRALKLKVIGMTPEELGHSANVLPRIPSEPDVSSEAMHDERQAFTSLHPPYGRYFYSYRDDPTIPPLVQQWSLKAGLGQNSFEPIRLTAEQKAALNSRMSVVFRMPKRVKVLQLENGDTLMLSFHQKIKWLPNSKRALVSLWKFGPVQTSADHYGRMYRTLYAVGFFHLSEPNWKRLNSDTIPGLKLSWFQYNHFTLPGVQS